MSGGPSWSVLGPSWGLLGGLGGLLGRPWGLLGRLGGLLGGLGRLLGRFGSHLGAGLGAIWVPEHDFLIGGIVVHSQKSTNTSGKATMVGGSTAPAVAAAVCGVAC